MKNLLPLLCWTRLPWHETADNFLCRGRSRAQDGAGLIIKPSSDLFIFHHLWIERDTKVSVYGCMEPTALHLVSTEGKISSKCDTLCVRSISFWTIDPSKSFFVVVVNICVVFCCSGVECAFIYFYFIYLFFALVNKTAAKVSILNNCIVLELVTLMSKLHHNTSDPTGEYQHPSSPASGNFFFLFSF